MTVTTALAHAVTEYMKPFHGSFAYQTISDGHLDISRFYPLMQAVTAYKPMEGATILSSGCGSAGDMYACLELGAVEAYGIEVDEKLLRLARARFQDTRYTGQVDLRLYDGFVLPYPDGLFDIITSFHVIEHTQNSTLYLTELFRVLKPGGILFLDVPNRYYYREQHTQMRFINLPPYLLRDFLLNILIAGPFTRLWSASTLEKLRALRGLRHPTPAQVLRACHRNRAACGIRVQDAFFHTYTDERLAWSSLRAKDLMSLFRELTTFRLVVQKEGGDCHQHLAPAQERRLVGA